MDDDPAIVGSGAAGFAVARAAATRGLRGVLAESGTLGGRCVTVGGIPSEALLAAADARHCAAVSAFPGIATAGPVDLAALLAGRDAIVAGLRRERYHDLVADYGWEVVRGRPIWWRAQLWTSREPGWRRGTIWWRPERPPGPLRFRGCRRRVISPRPAQSRWSVSRPLRWSPGVARWALETGQLLAISGSR